MKFQKGSIIRRPLEGMTGNVTYHTGIYIDENSVIHFNGEKKGDRNSVIQRVTLEEFAAEEDVKLHKSPDNDAHGESVCLKALEFHEQTKNEFNYKYSFVINNCESFTNRCFEAEYESVEIKRGRPPLSQVTKRLGQAVSFIAVTVVALIHIYKRTDDES